MANIWKGGIAIVKQVYQIPLLRQGGDSIIKRPANDAGVVEAAKQVNHPRKNKAVLTSYKVVEAAK